MRDQYGNIIATRKPGPGEVAAPMVGETDRQERAKNSYADELRR